MEKVELEVETKLIYFHFKQQPSISALTISFNGMTFSANVFVNCLNKEKIINILPLTHHEVCYLVDFLPVARNKTVILDKISMNIKY